MTVGDVVFRDVFAPTGSSYMQYQGMRFIITRPLVPGVEYDKTSENHRMYEIQLENGKTIHAFEDEVEV
jgi:hypothetical protein